MALEQQRRELGELRRDGSYGNGSDPSNTTGSTQSPSASNPTVPDSAPQTPIIQIWPITGNVTMMSGTAVPLRSDRRKVMSSGSCIGNFGWHFIPMKSLLLFAWYWWAILEFCGVYD
ncbi:hypothetical protein K461DRAFT_277405 [Myriangium duriaei CBS 260.36]|uniref:Uncharacterized protein n=1 Tax=Myriangium duriaei CBS 260.36 TaxID=1168546 RepID=A0A9P4J371_9PEZI|nr:hypothetical protein K461DRAFT_277405 [Myriangium duriaei CBS 260.36]